MKIADDLLAGYASGIAAVPGSGWTILRGAGTEDDIRITYKRINDDSNTAVVSVCASFHLPVPLRVTFDLLKNILLRPKVCTHVMFGMCSSPLSAASHVCSVLMLSFTHTVGCAGER